MPHETELDAGMQLKVDYKLCPDRRGDAHFEACYVRVLVVSRWGTKLPNWASTDGEGLPDFSRLMNNALMATDRRAPTAGNLRKRRRGEGTDFRQLRDYRQGDSQRSIDWKATARQQNPLAANIKKNVISKSFSYSTPVVVCCRKTIRPATSIMHCTPSFTLQFYRSKARRCGGA